MLCNRGKGPWQSLLRSPCDCRASKKISFSDVFVQQFEGTKEILPDGFAITGEGKRVSARLPGFERSGRYWGISERCHAIPSRRCGEFRGRNAHFWILSGFWMKSGTFFPHHWRCAVTEYISRFWIWVGVLSEVAPSLNGKSGW